MSDAALLDRPRERLAITSLSTPLPWERPGATRRPPGEMACAGEWHAVAAMLDDVAGGIAARVNGRSAFNVALIRFVTAEIRGAAAEIRANLALEELWRCQEFPHV